MRCFSSLCMVLLVRALRNTEAKSSIHILTAFLRKQTKNTLVIRISGVRFLGENGQWGNLSELMNVKALGFASTTNKNLNFTQMVKGSYSQSYGLSSSHIWMWELDHTEGWALKNWCFWTVVLEKILESPLGSKEIKPVNPKGNQPWVFLGRTDAEAPILWPPHAKSWLIGKDPDAGRAWGQEEKGMTEDEMAGWHH